MCCCALHTWLQDEAAEASAAVLQQLPAHLTSLVLTRDSYSDLAASSSAMAALAGLSALRSINIGSRDWTVCAAPLLPALQGLSQLSSLRANRIIAVAKLRHLPQVCAACSSAP